MHQVCAVLFLTYSSHLVFIHSQASDNTSWLWEPSTLWADPKPTVCVVITHFLSILLIRAFSPILREVIACARTKYIRQKSSPLHIPAMIRPSYTPQQRMFNSPNVYHYVNPRTNEHVLVASTRPSRDDLLARWSFDRDEIWTSWYAIL